MTTKHFSFFILFLPLLLVNIPAASSQSPEALVRAGDDHFNQGEYDLAFDRYRQAFDRLEMKRPIRPLLTDVVNNMAAVHMANGNLNEFRRYFAYAKTLKQQFAGKPQQHRPGNLLINGGFEQGLIFPWGTGHYERTEGKFRFGVWWNSNNARAYMKIDADVKHSGDHSLRITNFSPSAPHVFATLSQRIAPLEPNTTYRISCFVKAQDLKRGAVGITIDAAWTKRVRSFPGGTYDWQAYSDTINIGHNNYIDFRILHLNTGTIWLDGLVVEKVENLAETDPLKQAERLYDRADYGKALEILLKLEKEHPGNRGMLRNIEAYSGRIFLLLGQYGEALERFLRVIENGNPRANIDLADLYYRLGDFEKAEAHYKISFQIVAQDQGTSSLVMNKLSRCYLAQGKTDEALKAQERALYILRHIDDKHGQTLSLNQKGIIYQHKKMYIEAERPFTAALKMAGDLGDRKLVSDIAVNLAENYRLREKSRDANKTVAQALEIKEAIGDQLGIVKIRHLQARLAVAGGDLDTGRKRYRQAIERFEALASDAADISREAKATFLRGFSELYREYADLLMQLNEASGDAAYHQEAFHVAGQARSRTFTEMITEAAALQSFTATSKDRQFVELLTSERLLNARIHGLEKQIRSGPKADSNSGLKRELERIRQTRQNIRNRLLREYPRYSDLKNPGPLRIEDVQALLGADEIVLSYFISPGRAGLWAITREAASFSVIPLSREALIGQSEAFRKSFSNIPRVLSQVDPDRGKASIWQAFAGYRPEAAHHLYQVLVSPAAALLKSKTSVYLALDDLLYKLPFEALLTRPLSEKSTATPIIGADLRNAPFWVATHAIAYLPSLHVLRSLRTLNKGQAGQKSPLVAFADPTFEYPPGSPDREAGNTATRSSLLSRLKTRSALSQTTLSPLPDTRDEALAVARILGASLETDVYLQERASEYNLKRLPLNRYRHLLFATHGLMAGEFGPGTQPALALSFVSDPENDGLLEMGEILGLNLEADMVVLSACNTAGGGGDNDHGEGFAGLTRSFMYAGSRSLLVTQWSVESSTAKRLVQQTFTQAKNQPIGAALASAKRAMIASRAPLRLSPEIGVCTAHPFFWAPYVLVGEGR
jgi:CHAT domain-containing protein/tetratricopeptide (TPR) repeat protein